VTVQGFTLLFLTGFYAVVGNLSMKYGIPQARDFEPSVWAALQLIRQPAFVGILLIGIVALIWFRILATQMVVGIH
jgi:hypothetical protein